MQQADDVAGVEAYGADSLQWACVWVTVNTDTMLCGGGGGEGGGGGGQGVGCGGGAEGAG
jgi:hypothetical protein